MLVGLRGQGWPEVIAERRVAPLMPVGVVQTVGERVGGSAVSGVTVCMRAVQLVDAGRLGLMTRSPFVRPAAKGGGARRDRAPARMPGARGSLPASGGQRAAGAP